VKRLSVVSVAVILFCLWLPGCATMGGQGGWNQNQSCPSWDTEIYCLYVNSASAFYERLKDDIRKAAENEKKEILLLSEVKSAKDSQIQDAIGALNETIKMLSFYEGRTELINNYGGVTSVSAYKAASDTYAYIGGYTADMYINLGDMYARIGEKALAKKYYREVVIDYTGLAYRSYVKKAEFKLEDLK
jgi:hypothetical protein